MSKPVIIISKDGDSITVKSTIEATVLLENWDEGNPDMSDPECEIITDTQAQKFTAEFTKQCQALAESVKDLKTKLQNMPTTKSKGMSFAGAYEQFQKIAIGHVDREEFYFALSHAVHDTQCSPFYQVANYGEIVKNAFLKMKWHYESSGSALAFPLTWRKMASLLLTNKPYLLWSDSIKRAHKQEQVCNDTGGNKQSYIIEQPIQVDANSKGEALSLLAEAVRVSPHIRPFSFLTKVHNH